MSALPAPVPAASVTGPFFTSLPDAAARLGVSEWTLRRWAIESGHHSRLERRRIAFTETNLANLVRWVERQNHTDPEPSPAPAKADVWGE